ncbi:MAG: cysteine peptidase family C39 domain-containing protein [Oculatellaceae cyanobacterium Prado106]|jgi:predicted double-glycine peptidase|nr:cysteine peptidase family C39 domain-containing protein [Oculatellaceae cyanobacterium Prado106]
MALETIATLILGGLAFWWGMRLGRVLLRRGATANDLFKGKTSVSLLFLGLYVALMALALHVPQLQALPLAWRVSGMQVTWTILRIILLGFCGLTFVVSWKTARLQVVAIALIGILGLTAFTAAERYFLAPIYPYLEDNLQPNGIYEQTSNSSCAPSALATVLHRWGLKETESSMARLAGTSLLGTSMPQLAVATKAIGMDAIELSPTWEQMQRINRPGVLSTWLYSEGGRDHHAVALVALTKDSATVADPAFGKYFQVSRQQFDRIWRNEYLAVFRPQDIVLTAQQTADFLARSNYFPESSGVRGNGAGDHTTLTAAIRQFQKDMGIPATGVVNPLTALLLTGPFLTQVPTLNQPIDANLLIPTE